MRNDLHNRDTQATRQTFTDLHDAWDWNRAKLPSSPTIEPADLLLIGLKDWPGRHMLHADIGAGEGQHLHEISSLVERSFPRSSLTSWGSEVFLYPNASYNRADPRIVSPDKLTEVVTSESATIVTVIAPDPFSPHRAEQMISGMQLVHPKGLLFVRDEPIPTGLGLLLGSGFTVSELGARLGQTLLPSSYDSVTRLMVAWRDNPKLEQYLHEHGATNLQLTPGQERLKMLAWSLMHCGMHRHTLPIEWLGKSSGLEPRAIRELISSWKDDYESPFLRRFETRGRKEVLY